MLTPRFELSQTENEVTIIVHAPYANIKDTLVEVNGSDFRFYSTPYFLRLNLPGEIEENDASTGDYNCDKGDFTLKFSKVIKGEHFENLDMITNLLAPKKKKNPLPTIEVISNPCASSSEKEQQSQENPDEEDEAEDNEMDDDDQWYENQILPSENIQLPFQSSKYGFANKISGALAQFEAEGILKDVVDLPSPDKTSIEDRKNLQEQDELQSFDEEHYMADLVQPETCLELSLSYECQWEKIIEIDIKLSDEEKDLLKELPNKEYLMDPSEINIALYGMIDILFASCYNCRETLSENTVVSAWTINKLSSTLCWFQSFTNLHDVIKSSIRRSLCYPRLRHWELSQKVFEDVKKIVKLGKKCIIKNFCTIHSLFNNSDEPRYILNQLYIKDYLIWLQQIPNSLIEELSPLLENINIKKEELGLDLVELEVAAFSVLEENVVIENNLYSLPDDLEKLIIGNDDVNLDCHPSLNNDNELDSDDDSSSTSSSSSSSDSSTSDSSTSSSSSSDSSIIKSSVSGKENGDI